MVKTRSMSTSSYKTARSLSRSRSRGRQPVRTPHSGLPSLRSASSSGLNALLSLARSSPNPLVQSAATAIRIGRSLGGARRQLFPAKKKKVGRYVKREEGIYKGRLVKKFKKRKIFSKFGFNGNIFRFEQNGIVNDKQCVYIGHAVGFDPFIHGVMRAIYCTLMTMAKQTIGSWEEVTTYQIRLKWNYRKESDYSKLNVLDQLFNIGAQHKIIGDWMYDGNSAQSPAITGLKAQFSGAKISDQLSLYSVALYNNNLSDTQPLAILYFDTYQIQWKVTSRLDIQNTTVADWVDNTNSANNNAALKTNIFANPLKGVVYSNIGKGNKHCNGFLDKSMGRMAANKTHFMPDFTTTPSIGPSATEAVCNFFGDRAGLIAQKSANLPMQYLKPPFPWRFEGRVKSAPCYINPGDIKKDTFVFKGYSMINNWFGKHGSRICEGFDYDPANNKFDKRWNFGHAHMIAVEKLLDSKADSEKNLVTCAFELNAVYAIKLVKKRVKPLGPFTWVQSTDINAAAEQANDAPNPNIDMIPGDGDSLFM